MNNPTTSHMGVSEPLKDVPTNYNDSLQLVYEKKFTIFFSKSNLLASSICK